MAVTAVDHRTFLVEPHSVELLLLPQQVSAVLAVALVAALAVAVALVAA